MIYITTKYSMKTKNIVNKILVNGFKVGNICLFLILCYGNMQNATNKLWAEEKYCSTIWSPVRNDQISRP